MRKFVQDLRDKPVDTSAVQEAYSGGTRFVTLQKALVRQISSDLMLEPSSFIWFRENFRKSGLDRKAEFFRDITYAMCVGSEVGNEKSEWDQKSLRDLLVKE